VHFEGAQHDDDGAGGRVRMARLPGFAQRVVAFDVGLRFGGERLVRKSRGRSSSSAAC
jgi:hypothetical protein